MVSCFMRYQQKTKCYKVSIMYDKWCFEKESEQKIKCFENEYLYIIINTSTVMQVCIEEHSSEFVEMGFFY
jgi:hypothetical protein